jgi:uncharacterized protein (TIGR03435 family)
MEMSKSRVATTWLVALLGGMLWAQEARPMSANANPGFEVVTIKLADRDVQGKDFGFQGRQFMAQNYNVNDIIALAYGLHFKQIVGPAWMGTTLYDINGIPDTDGIPNQSQKALMMQKLLAERFKLRFHLEKRELAVYTITLAKGGPKLTPTASASDAPSNFRLEGLLRGVRVSNMTLAEFSIWFQKGVMDKPVIDRSGLTAKYDFNLMWSPDESQFIPLRGTGAKAGRWPDDEKSPPGLYSAFQEQLGLRLEPIKAPADVMVVDHVEKPLEN